MLLPVDIGNTNIAVGVWSADRLVANWRVAPAHHGASTLQSGIVYAYAGPADGLSADSRRFSAATHP